MNDKLKIPDPYHLIVSLSLFNSIKYNQGLQPGKTEVSEKEVQEFEKFKLLFKEFLNKLNEHDSGAFTLLSSIMNMWGYSRKYCGMCGKPIIGKPGHIENRMVCPSCNESYRITEALLRGDDPHQGYRPRDTVVNPRPPKGGTGEVKVFKRNPPGALNENGTTM
jgi:uncharacterized protein YbaR (Trm112 family)